jgi:cyclic pyranopterin monophosphate synthase
MSELSHINPEGKAVMVDVSNKPMQLRKAIATGFITLQPGTVKLIGENLIKKGDVLTVAQIAGIQAAKQTSSLIPLCHPLQISKIDVTLSLCEKGVNCRSLVICSGQTGVEMEALTAVSVALLAVYDMCKSVDKQMVISEIRLMKKTKTDI